MSPAAGAGLPAGRQASEVYRRRAPMCGCHDQVPCSLCAGTMSRRGLLRGCGAAAAAAALGELNDARAMEPLIAMVLKEEARWRIPRTGLAALAKLGHAGAAEALEHGRHRSAEWWQRNKEKLLRGR